MLPRKFFGKKNKEEKYIYAGLRAILGFRPGNFDLYKLALRHRSAAQEIRDGFRNSNERLEFLGDAILGAVIADLLFKKYPYKDEGFLTKMRSKLVSRSHINQLSQKLGLDRLIEFNSEAGRPSGSMRGDALEALIGAVYIDKGFKRAEKFVTNIFLLHVDLDEVQKKDVDFKSKLVEWTQKERKRLSFEIIGEEGKGFHKLYTVNVLIDAEVYGTGKGHSKKLAEQAAAEKACLRIEESAA
jgi:ribonuclease III